MVTEPDQVERANAAKRNQRCLSNQMTAPLHACDAWQIEAQQKRKRRRYGQYIRDELSIRKAEENKNKRNPDDQQQSRLEAVGLARHFERAPDAPPQDSNPRQKTGDDDRNEIIKGAWTVLLRRQITSEMLDDKEKLEESGIAGLNQHKPRRCNGAKDQHAAHKIKPPPERPVARDQRIERERCTWQQHANQPLGEHSQRHGSPA